MSQIESEFGTSFKELEKRRRALAIEPGEDGCYTSRQVAAILFGDKEAETIQKINAERRSTELNMEITRKERIPLEQLNSVNAECFGAIEAIIKANRDKVLTQDVIDDINGAMRDVPHKLRWTK